MNPGPDENADDPAPGRTGRWSRRRVKVMALVLALAVGGWLGQVVWRWGEDKCLWSPDVPFRALLNDPLADKELLGLKLDHASETRGSTLGNLISLNPLCRSVLDRAFTPGPDGAAADARRIVEFAEDNGWVVTDRFGDNGDFSAWLRKPHSQSAISAWVRGDDDPAARSPRVSVEVWG
ncbi:MAG: hypothetical protein LBK95_05990 [Bifidobacteriaceae bacterium]|jgi:hypothetical protein|nr:hypothetical protein [Bifidobacteriaceae bacterium]